MHRVYFFLVPFHSPGVPLMVPDPRRNPDGHTVTPAPGPRTETVDGDERISHFFKGTADTLARKTRRGSDSAVQSQLVLP